MRILLGLLALIVVAALAGAVWLRMASDDPAIWHVDPLDGASTGKPNEARISPPGGSGGVESPVFDMSAEVLARRLDAVAMAESRVSRLAGGAEDGFTTYVQRSRIMGFPDYVSARAVDMGEGRSALAIWSRARYGTSDLGVNQARLERWLAAIE
jgi:hypothetical protein